MEFIVYIKDCYYKMVKIESIDGFNYEKKRDL